MSSKFILCGSTGFVGSIIANLAVQNNLHPILAGLPRLPARLSASDRYIGLFTLHLYVDVHAHCLQSAVPSLYRPIQSQHVRFYPEHDVL